MNTVITSTVNEGFCIERGEISVFIDAFTALNLPSKQHVSCYNNYGNKKHKLILATHCHFDHFDAEQIALVVSDDVKVVGPASITEILKRRLNAVQLITLEPKLLQRNSFADSQTIRLGSALITALRTQHSEDHNSYLIEIEGLRLFHDGDNENTRCIPTRFVEQVDALFIAPWQGSGWVDFVERIKPRYWFLMHLDEEELDKHGRGEYLPDLCDHIPFPERLIVLRPGESFSFSDNE